ncbi:MAG TPA: rRNA maturation RNase YbeY [Rhabdochlamydiaceae bacterium]|jgi:probable rRNA maturation factor
MSRKRHTADAAVCTLYNTQKDLPLSIRKYKRAILSLLKHLKIATDEVIVHFVSEKKISALHRQFFNDPTPTDCISIPIDAPNRSPSGYRVLGEVFVCAKAAKTYAEEQKIAWRRELMRYVVHGLLHLIGYDDIKLKDRKKMQSKEEECLQFLESLFLI